jgi:hypothetical protein
MTTERFGQALIGGDRGGATRDRDRTSVGIHDEQPHMGERFGAHDVVVN